MNSIGILRIENAIFTGQCVHSEFHRVLLILLRYLIGQLFYNIIEIMFYKYLSYQLRAAVLTLVVPTSEDTKDD